MSFLYFEKFQLFRLLLLFVFLQQISSVNQKQQIKSANDDSKKIDKQQENKQESQLNYLHPCLQHQVPPFWFRLYRATICCIHPIFLPIRGILVLILILISSFIDYLLNLGTDQTKPLPKVRQNMFRISKEILFKTTLFLTGFITLQNGKPDQHARAIIANHQSGIDIILAQAVGIQSAVSKEGIADNFIFGNTIKVSRSILARKADGSATRLLTERLTQQPQIYPPIGIFPEGTTVSQDVVTKFRTGTFLSKPDIQIVTFDFKTYHNISYIAGGGFRHIFNLLFNPPSIIKVTFHETLHAKEDETVQQYMERCRQLMAEYNHAQLVPFTFKDCMWFNGSTKVKKEDVTKEYMEEFGWMGQWKDYKQLCIKHGRDPYYQWSKKQLKVE